VSATPEMIAAAWAAWHARHGGKLGPGPAFVEAINAAVAVCPGRLAGLREAAEVAGAFGGKPCGRNPAWSADENEGYENGQIDASAAIARNILALAERGEG
jgi:hypothetical protein